jgi:hypothetical protein
MSISKGYDIVGVYRGEKEVVDHAEDRTTAKYLVGEYQLAYGNEWRVYYRTARAEEES